MRTVWFLLSLSLFTPVAHAVDYNDYFERSAVTAKNSQAELDYYRRLKLEEKRIEVLARLNEFSASDVTVNASASSSPRQASHTSSTASQVKNA